MADSIYTFDPTAINNSSLDSIPYGPNQLYHNKIDDLFRAYAAKLAQFVDDLGAANTVAGTADAITVTLASGITAYATGQLFRFIAGAANTGAATMNVNSIGAKAIRKISGGTDVALSAGDIAAGETYLVIYRASANAAAGAWVIIGGAAVAAATTSAAGIVELATLAETLAGTDTSRAVVPANLYFPTGHLYGLTLSNNVSDATNDIDIAAGTARDGSDSYNMILASALTKRLDASWAVGTGNGGLDTGSIANTTYHVWLIKRSDTGVVDALFSTSASSPTMPTNYDIKRRIGSIIRASGAIVAFKQLGDEFLRSASVLDVNAANPGTSAVSRTLSVPTGINVWAIINAQCTNAAAGVSAVLLLSELDRADEAASFTAAPLGNVGRSANVSGSAAINNTRMVIRTNTSAQIRSRVDASDANVTVLIATTGWIDNRGKDGF